MGSALAAGVSGLKAHEAMLDVAGNNLSNVNTVGYKASNITFAELLSQTIKKASGPTGALGGTNPQQAGSGVGISAVSRNMSQGNLYATGQDLDVAIDGQGYFVLNDGAQNVYTRRGSFAVDADNTLVDPATGYKVQRLGSEGETDGFQTTGDSSIHIPWDASMPASATAAISMNGNLRSSASANDVTYHKLTANSAFTTGTGTAVTAATYMSDLDQWTVPLGVGNTGTLRISGTTEDGTVFTNQDVTWTGAAAGAGDTVQDMLDQITALYDHSTATVNADGKITIIDDNGGYSQAQITAMSYVPTGADRLTVPTFFNLTVPGGNDSKAFNINVYDSMGEPHVLSGYLVKTDTTNTWDMVIPSISGESAGNWSGYDLNSATFNRRISGIQFNSDGSYGGLANTAEPLTIGVQFDNIPGDAKHHI